MFDECSEGSRVVLAVGIVAVLLAIAFSIRVIVYMIRMARRIRARLDSHRVIVVEVAREISAKGSARRSVNPPAPR